MRAKVLEQYRQFKSSKSRFVLTKAKVQNRESVKKKKWRNLLLFRAQLYPWVEHQVWLLIPNEVQQLLLADVLELLGGCQGTPTLVLMQRGDIQHLSVCCGVIQFLSLHILCSFPLSHRSLILSVSRRPLLLPPSFCHVISPAVSAAQNQHKTTRHPDYKRFKINTGLIEPNGPADSSVAPPKNLRCVFTHLSIDKHLIPQLYEQYVTPPQDVIA